MKNTTTVISSLLIVIGIIFRVLAFIFKDASTHNTYALIGVIAVAIGIILIIIKSITKKSLKETWVAWLLLIIWAVTCILTTK